MNLPTRPTSTPAATVWLDEDQPHAAENTYYYLKSTNFCYKVVLSSNVIIMWVESWYIFLEFRG